jgi:hypothetical protein
MYFQLLHGVHIEHGRVYKTEGKLSEQNGYEYTFLPVIKSDVDLMKMFGPKKFARLSDEEGKRLLKKEKAVGKEPSSLDAETQKSDVAKAALEGAHEITVSSVKGKEVTERYEGADAAGLRIFRKAKGEYLVFAAKDGALVTAAGPITKKETEKLIEQYLE